ncbi:MAG: rhomboid family intramembrane serine protease [Caulobacteraceae bacterium]|nr:rhomboid family intramembrane serine protease [Caulobacteraceae bacterium]
MAEQREPAINAPWPVLTLIGLIAAVHAAQVWGPQGRWIIDLAFTPAGLMEGRWTPLITAIFLHGGWLHLFINAAFLLAFGVPVARYLGSSLSSALMFFIFFLVCGVLGSLAYAAFDPSSRQLMVGASGAVAGLMGAASRLVERRGRLGPFGSRTVIFMGLAWLVVNLLVAVFNFAPGAGDAQIAWQAHLAGYAAGLVLIGPFGWMAGADMADAH